MLDKSDSIYKLVEKSNFSLLLILCILSFYLLLTFIQDLVKTIIPHLRLIKSLITSVLCPTTAILCLIYSSVLF